MPVTKYAAIRHRIIDQLIGNKYKPYPSKYDLISACKEALFEEISERTIEKDIKDMKLEYDAPIKYSREHEGYYYEIEGYSIDLTSSQIEAIKMAANLLNQFRNTEIFKDFDTAIDKILDRVSISNDSKTIDEFVQFESAPKVLGTSHLNPILHAIKYKQNIAFNYLKFDSKESTHRIISPFLLKEYRNRWYVIGKELKTGGVKTFGLDRIQDLEVLNQVFEEHNFNKEVFFENTIGITVGTGMPEEVVIRADKIESNYLKTQPLHKSQKVIKETDLYAVFQLKVVVTKELEMQLLSFGEGVKVLEPKNLKESIVTKLKNTLKKYE